MDISPTQALVIEVVPDPSPEFKIVRLKGPITFHNVAAFQDFVKQRPMPKVLIVDLTNVPYIDSAALGVFVSVHVARENTDCRYAFAGPNERLRNLFELAFVGTFLVVFSSLAEAENHFRSL